MPIKLRSLVPGAFVTWMTKKEGTKRGTVIGFIQILNGAAWEVLVLRLETGKFDTWLLWKREMGPCWRVEQ